MTLRVRPGAVSRRKGTGVLPPNPEQWNYEHCALDLRDDLGVPPDQRLDHAAAFALTPRTLVVPHGRIPVAAEYADHFRKAGSGSWSGFALPVGDGVTMVVYNDSHPLTRTRATLMEEFFHIRFDHPLTVIRAHLDGNRTHDAGVEQEAYHTGAAALVPFKPMKAMLDQGQSFAQIADHFLVSQELVEFRAKVTKQFKKSRWRNQRRRTGSRGASN